MRGKLELFKKEYKTLETVDICVNKKRLFPINLIKMQMITEKILSLSCGVYNVCSNTYDSHDIKYNVVVVVERELLNRIYSCKVSTFSVKWHSVNSK